MKYKVRVKDNGVEIEVRKMEKDEMPDDDVEYYCDDERGQIYKKGELVFIN